LVRGFFRRVGISLILPGMVLAGSRALQGAQDVQEAQEPPVRFAVEVNYVEVDIVVVDEKLRFCRTNIDGDSITRELTE
jgi:hypothetical protein